MTLACRQGTTRAQLTAKHGPGKLRHYPKADDITYYDTLDDLLRADPKAKVIKDNWGDLVALFPFLE